MLGFIPWGLKFVWQAQKKRREQNKNATIALHKHALKAWQDLLQRTGNQNMMHNCGYLKVWEKESALEAIKQNQIEEQKHGYDCEILSGEAVFKKEPALSKKVKHALYFPNSQQLLEPHQTVLKLFKYFKKEGGVFLKAEVQNIECPQGEVSIETIIDTNNEKQHYQKAVVCSGVWSKKLCEQLNNESKHKLNIPLTPERGYHLTFFNSPIKYKHIIMSQDRHIALTPLSTPKGTAMRITGFGEFSKINTKTITKRYQTLRVHINALINGMDTVQQEPETWIGMRPTLPDSLPVIDTHPQYPQLGMVFGHQHLGVTQAPISAKIIVALMNKEESEQTLADFEDVIESFAVDRF